MMESNFICTKIAFPNSGINLKGQQQPPLKGKTFSCVQQQFYNNFLFDPIMKNTVRRNTIFRK